MDTDGRVAFLVRGLQTRTLLRCSNDANDLRLVWVTGREVRRQHEHLLGSGMWRSVLGSTTFTEADLDDAAVREVAGVTGLSLHRAGVWIATADTLCGSMPRIVDALAAGRLDLARATTVADECTGLTDAQARVVEQAVLEALPDEVLDGTVPVGPWDVMSPKKFTAMVKKAVAEVRTDTDEAIVAEVRERTGTWLEIDRANPALAVWTITGPTEQLVAAEEAARRDRARHVARGAGRADARHRQGRPDHRRPPQRRCRPGQRGAARGRRRDPPRHPRRPGPRRAGRG